MESVFYELAKEFCQYVRENIISKESLDYLIEIIMKLLSRQGLYIIVKESWVTTMNLMIWRN